MPWGWRDAVFGVYPGVRFKAAPAMKIATVETKILRRCRICVYTVYLHLLEHQILKVQPETCLTSRCTRCSCSPTFEHIEQTLPKGATQKHTLDPFFWQNSNEGEPGMICCKIGMYIGICDLVNKCHSSKWVCL